MTSYKALTPIELPDMPLAGLEVSIEYSKLCMGDKEKRCEHLSAWLNKLYLFRQQYQIIQKDFRKK